VAEDKERSAPADAEEPENKVASSEEQASGVPRWLVVTAALALAVVAIVIVYGYLARPKPEWVGVANKNFWNWLDLLVVPAALAIGVYWLNTRQAARQQREEDQRQAREAEAEEARVQRAERTQREQVEQALYVQDRRAQDEALQAYLDQMSQLLTDKERPLHRARAGDSLSTVARARTLSVLGRLDGGRKGTVIQFLYESGLISKSSDYFGGPVVNLNGADLSGADLYGTYLRGAVLGTYPAGREIPTTFVVRTDLRGADLGNCNLQDAELGYTDLEDANFDRTDLWRANLYQASLVKASFRVAHLRGTNLLDAQPAEGVVFTQAVGKTNEEIEQEVGYLEGAAMPDGQKYEDWLMSRGRGEDGENNGPS